MRPHHEIRYLEITKVFVCFQTRWMWINGIRKWLHKRFRLHSMWVPWRPVLLLWWRVHSRWCRLYLLRHRHGVGYRTTYLHTWVSLLFYALSYKTSMVKSVKCNPGGAKKWAHSINIWDTVTNVLPLCSVYQAPSYQPNLTLLAPFPT